MIRRIGMGLCVLLAAQLASAIPGDQTIVGPIDKYNVVWNTPSGDSSGSMPFGNGDIGINAWTEENGDIVFYISKTDAWSDNARLLKLGRVRVKFTPNPFEKGEPFAQGLYMGVGRIFIGSPNIIVGLWVDANNPVIHIDTECMREFDMQVSLETWRTAEREITGKELFSAYGMNEGQPMPVIEYPDTIVDAPGDRVVWHHRNERSIWPFTMKHQGLEPLMKDLADPLLHRTFGGAIIGEEFVKANATTIKTRAPRRRHLVSIYVLTSQTETADEWMGQLDETIQRVEAKELRPPRKAHQQWWDQFWDRSWIRVSGTASAPTFTTNTLPLRIGADSEGGNRFVGRIRRARVFGRALSEKEIAALAKDSKAEPADVGELIGDWNFANLKNGVFANSAGDGLDAKIVDDVEVVGEGNERAARFTGKGWIEVADDPRFRLSKSTTLEAWIAPDALPQSGVRIIDKSKAGTSNGYLLDTYPGNSLRMIIEPNTLLHEAKLPVGQWSHVAATYDSQTGEQRIYHNGKAVASASLGQDLFRVSQGYALQRFIAAGAGRGHFPIKFNGSIFTVDSREKDEVYDADYRRWGGPYWFQNTRLPYWAMLAAGDFDMMRPLFKMYMDALPFAQERTGLYFNHGGAFFPETMYFWGAYANNNYGWNRANKPISEVENTYIRYYYSGGLELAAIMLEYYRYTQDGGFLKSTLVPFADAVTRFYGEHYPRDAAGKLRIEPSQALETWQQATNPLPPIAGLKWVLSGLLELPEDQSTPDRRAAWKKLLDAVPPLPTKEESGARFLLPAEKFDNLSNIENPELYAVFPYRFHGLGKPDLEVAREAFKRRIVKKTGGWHQDAIQAALLGLTDTAADFTARNFTNKHEGSRFPAFWGPNYDWIPDQDHGSVAMTALQTMLMQCEGREIRLFPAWPKSWDVEFKLHAPFKTTVEGVYKSGRLEQLKVTPESRAQDVITTMK